MSPKLKQLAQRVDLVVRRKLNVPEVAVVMRQDGETNREAWARLFESDPAAARAPLHVIVCD